MRQIEADMLTLMTMVVTKTNVTFFRGVETVAVLELELPLSDCFSPNGLHVGENGLTLGNVMFYPCAWAAPRAPPT